MKKFGNELWRYMVTSALSASFLLFIYITFCRNLPIQHIVTILGICALYAMLVTIAYIQQKR